MSGCCDPRGCQDIFGAGFARRMARRYRRRGVTGASARMVDFLQGDGLDGLSVLEIGGGVGEIGVELLRRGAASATTVELTDAYDAAADALATEAGVTDRVHRRVLDVATDAQDVQPADLVVLHRVVCCYPDYPRLLGAAADLCLRRIAFSHPPRNLVSRTAVATQNTLLRLSRKEFRIFVHPPQAMAQTVADRGLRPVLAQQGRVWQVEGLTR